MTPEERGLFDRAVIAIERIAESQQRLADHFAPIERKERKPATLGVAAYSEEEREQLRLRQYLKSQVQKQKK